MLAHLSPQSNYRHFGAADEIVASFRRMERGEQKFLPRLFGSTQSGDWQ